MSGEYEMEFEENTDQENYIRNIEDVNTIIKYAKLDTKSLTQITQALYYPTEDILGDNVKLLELDDHMVEQIRVGQILQFKGGVNEKVVLCTDEKTYDIKGAEISNSLLLVPDLKFGAATSESPLKSPRTGNSAILERSLNDSTEDDVDMNRILEHRKVIGIFHEYIECREIRPRFQKLGDLLQLTRYSGPENEDNIDRKLLFTYDQLLGTIQSSRKQFDEGLKHYRAIEHDGYVRVMECDYEFRIINYMINLINENSWKLDEIDKIETIESLDGIAPQWVVEGLFELYTKPLGDKHLKYTYNEELVARIVAKNILQPGLKFRMDEFMSCWIEALPDGMNCEERYLKGLGIFDKDGSTSCVRALAEENLSTNIQERMRILFKTKTKWTMEEMEPYIECFTTSSLTVSTLLAKYARSVREGNIRYFVAKH